MRHTRLIAMLLLAAYLPACTSYRVMADPVTGLQPSPNPVAWVRVTLRSGEHFVLDLPRVDADSLRGIDQAGSPRSVALADVSHVDVRKDENLKTLGLIAAAAMLALVVVGVVAFMHASE